MTEIDQLLRTAIQAAKAGEREKAHQLLLQIVEQDEQNETAWLWLSGTVKTKEDRQICLENVLAINPNNKMAQKGLQKLGATPASPPPEEVEEEKEVWAEPVYDLELPEVDDPHKPRYQDVWSSSAHLCAYCAQPVQRKDRRCPKCKRKMVGKEPVFPNRTQYLQNWIVFRIVGHVLFLLITTLNYLVIAEYASLALIPWEEFKLARTRFWTTLATELPTSIGLTVALYFRKVWAYWLAILGVIITLLSIVAFILFTPIPLNSLISTWEFALTSIFAIIYLVLAVYFTFMGGADFQREKRWRIAVADDRIKDPLVLDKAGKLFAQRGMWATAVLYWQRAVGRSPGNVAILRRLASGYARLGFPQRSLDTLQQVQQKTLDPKTRQSVTSQIELMRQKIDQLNSV
ncbi:tetratricopeptide repeat protein [Candidatus Leptofilum sp.]|uniref:tetratricopeptide repeat protein n=1 Tax=Candidatus Leptofilum sp. TaxID=3241576 RepID=UPI003B5CE13B